MRALVVTAAALAYLGFLGLAATTIIVGTEDVGDELGGLTFFAATFVVVPLVFAAVELWGKGR